MQENGVWRINRVIALLLCHIVKKPILINDMKTMHAVKFISFVLLLLITYSKSNSQIWENIGNIEYFDPHQSGFFEILGEYSEENYPYIEGYSHLSWNIKDELFYVFDSNTSSMWVYSTEIHQWKCIVHKNSSVLVASDINQESLNNTPGIRSEIRTATWHDNEGNLWLFSGSDKSDLWRFNTTTNMWSFMGGSHENGNGNYIDKGIESPEAYPAYRKSMPNFFVDQNGHFVLFRGSKANDLWRYNPYSQRWTWVDGLMPSEVNVIVLENIETDSSLFYLNTPTSSNQILNVSWADNNNHYYIMDKKNYVHRVWKYDTIKGLWFLVHKPEDFANYSVFGIEDDDLQPEMQKSCSIWQNDENIYVWGGKVNGLNREYTNTLFRFNKANFNWTWLSGITSKNEEGEYDPLVKNNGFVHATKGFHPMNLPSPRSNSLVYFDNSSLFIIMGKTDKPCFDKWEFDTTINQFQLLEGSRGKSQADLYNGSTYQFNNIETSSYLDNNTPQNYMIPSIHIGDNLYVLNGRGFSVKNITTNITTKIRSGGLANEGEIGVESDETYPGVLSYIIGEKDQYIYFINISRKALYRFNINTNKFTCILKVENHENPIFREFNENYFPIYSGAKTCWIKDNVILLYSASGGSSVWAYDIELNMFAWVSGDYNLSIQSPIREFPKKRKRYNHWVDKNNDLWIYGGHIYVPSGFLAHYHQTDMWKFDSKNYEWKKINVGPGVNSSGVYIGKGSFSIFSHPGGRSRYSSFVDSKNKFWMINGNTYRTQDAQHVGGRTVVDDIWMFDPIVKRWVWINGFDKELLVSDDTFRMLSNKKPFARIKNGSNSVFEGHNTYSFVNDSTGYLYENYFGSLWKLNLSQIFPEYNIFSGTALYDSDQNGCDSLDQPMVNLKVYVDEDSDYTFTDSLGQYAHFCNEKQCDVFARYELDYFNIEPEFVPLDFDGYGEQKTVNYCVSAKEDIIDLSISMIPTNPVSCGGSDQELIISYRNDGTVAQSGEIEFYYDVSQFNYKYSYPDTLGSSNITLVGIDTLIWDFSELQPFESREIKIFFGKGHDINLGDTLGLKSMISIDSLERTPINNTFELHTRVVNPWDDYNNILLNGELLPPSLIGEDLHYLIRYNTNDLEEGSFIVIHDELDPDLFDLSSIETLYSTYNYQSSVLNDSILQIVIPATEIELVTDSTAIFAFKIESLESLQPGDYITNEVTVYSGYNMINEYNTSYAQFEYITSHTSELQIVESLISPNPATDVLTIKGDPVRKIKIYDAQGRIVCHAEKTNSVDISQLIAGIYYIEIHTQNGSKKEKFIKIK